ncbi:cystinosin-like protein ERS1 [Nakaseomyces bracarensis]|uniref:cystinosin-like protein ERS1 n=1 Tax=Nakaseomyces bracarensis TaxID=273131 RepID=UPI0038720E1D
MEIDNILGFIYVSAWSVSMYSPLITNWRHKSARAMSTDFVLLNLTGYFYLVCSLTLQLYKWLPEKPDDTVERPKLSGFDYCYCLHGFCLTAIMTTQLFYGRELWGFTDEYRGRMKKIYKRVLMISIFTFCLVTLQFVYDNRVLGWDNSRTLIYCNKLFFLKITMSLIKYIPQVLHNYERKSMKGFAISGVFLDITSGIASIIQLICQVLKDTNINLDVIVSNFGKVGLALVTLMFNFIFISQWLIYEKTSKGNEHESLGNKEKQMT